MKRCLQTLLLAGLLVFPASAGRELDNRNGRLDGSYVAEFVRINEPDQEEKQIEKVPFRLEVREIWFTFPDGKHEKARVDQIYDTGFKTEITARNPDKDIHYLVRVQGSMAPR